MKPAATPLLVVYVLSLPREPVARRHAAINCWLRSQAAAVRQPFSDNEVERIAQRHPLFAEIRAFASARLCVTEEAAEMDELVVSVGPEQQVLEAAAGSLHRHRGTVLTYAGRAWPTRLLASRSLLSRTPVRHILADGARRTLDVADSISIAEFVEAPPLGLAMSELGLGQWKQAPLLSDQESDLGAGEHARIVEEAVWTLDATARIYAALHLGDVLPTTWKPDDPRRIGCKKNDSSPSGPATDGAGS